MSKKVKTSSLDVGSDPKISRHSLEDDLQHAAASFKKKSDTIIHSPMGPSVIQPPTQVNDSTDHVSAHHPPTGSTGSQSSYTSVHTPSSLSSHTSHASGKSQRSNMRHIELQHVGADLLAENYYHGIMQKNEVDRLLVNDGDFLVCVPVDKANKEAVVSLAVRFGGKPRFFIIGKTRKGRVHITRNCFDSVPLLIKHYTSTREALSLQPPIVLKNAVSMPEFIIVHTRILKGDLIGKGQFGKVFKATLISGLNLRKVAVKTLRTRNLQDTKLRSLFLQEAKTMKEYCHPNIVNFVGFAGRQEPLMIVLEFCANGSLLSHLRTSGSTMRTETRVRFLAEAAAGMRYLESLKVIHRDIAARNCLLDEHMSCKISDFGMSIKENQDTGATKVEEESKMPIKWLAPEVLQHKKFSIKSDVWAYGVLVCEVFTNGAEPYPGITTADVKNLIGIKRHRMDIPAEWPPYIHAVIQGCWQEDPSKRPTFEDICICLKRGHR